MPIQIIQYILIGVSGLFAGGAIMEAITGDSAPANYIPPTVIESGVSPYMLIAGAILLVSLAYCVKSLVISVKSCTSGSNNQPNYYE